MRNPRIRLPSERPTFTPGLRIEDSRLASRRTNLMTDAPDKPETPIQRALRMKKAAEAAKPKPPRGGRFQREQAAAAHSASRSKPWMKA
jgi:hypothetical protein